MLLRGAKNYLRFWELKATQHVSISVISRQCLSQRTSRHLILLDATGVRPRTQSMLCFPLRIVFWLRKWWLPLLVLVLILILVFTTSRAMEGQRWLLT
jgi:hypothetical protein